MVSDGQKGQETGESWNLFLLRHKPSLLLQLLHVLPAGHQVNTPDRTTDRSCQECWCCLARVKPSQLLPSTSELALPALCLNLLWGGAHQGSAVLQLLLSAGLLTKQNILVYMTLLWGKNFCNSRDAFMADLILPLRRETSATAEKNWFSLPNILLLLAGEIFSLLKLPTQLLSCSIFWTPENI